MQNRRNVVLDMGRFVAILSVMLFHYYSIWAYRGDQAYPYGGEYDFFSWGHLGVEFFFVLTGFFIVSSLERSNSLLDFWKKKLVRLGIPLLLCSLTTFCVFRLLDTDGFSPDSAKLKNLIVSCTMINPNLFNLLFGTNLGCINGSYWFLWVECQFLLLVSILFFKNRKSFVRNFGIVSLFLYIVWYVVRRIMENYFLTNKLGLPFTHDTMQDVHDWVWVLNLPAYIFYLAFGMTCSLLSKKNYKECLWLLPVMLFSIVSKQILSYSVENVIIWGILIFWVLYAIYGRQFNLKGKAFGFFAELGESSYGVYLLHEFIGVLLIHKYAYLFGDQMWILPILLIMVMFGIGWMGYNYIEKPLTKKILSR